MDFENLTEKQIDEKRQGETFSIANAENGGKKMYIESYGCQMNFSDSEIVASILYKEGFSTTNDIEKMKRLIDLVTISVLLDAGAGDAHGVHGDITLIQLGDEFLAEAGELPAGGPEQDEGGDEHERALAQREIEHRRVRALGGAHQFVFLLSDFAAHEQRDHRRHEGERKDKGGGEREDDRERHGMK